MTYWQAMHYYSSDVCALSKHFWTLEVSVKRKSSQKDINIYRFDFNNITTNWHKKSHSQCFPKGSSTALYRSMKTEAQCWTIAGQLVHWWRAKTFTGSGDITKTADPDHKHCQFIFKHQSLVKLKISLKA